MDKNKLDKESLLTGRLSTIDLLVLTSEDQLTPFDIANIIYFFCKTSYLNEEVICTEPSRKYLA